MSQIITAQVRQSPNIKRVTSDGTMNGGFIAHQVVEDGCNWVMRGPYIPLDIAVANFHHHGSNLPLAPTAPKQVSLLTALEEDSCSPTVTSGFLEARNDFCPYCRADIIRVKYALKSTSEGTLSLRTCPTCSKLSR